MSVVKFEPHHGYVYFLRPTGAEGPVKIGHSRYPDQRLWERMTWSPLPLEIAAEINAPMWVEQQFHTLFAHLHSHREWFRSAPELTAVIEQVANGDFDLGTLPKARRMGRAGPRTPLPPEAA